jgi:tripartite-type tricarboxylate transporter receptor subunit TctC
VPTLQEQGLKGADVGIWHGLYAPKGTPKPVIDKLVSSLQEAMKDPTVNQRFTELGAVSFPADKQTPAALQAHLKAEIDKWAPLIKRRPVRRLEHPFPPPGKATAWWSFLRHWNR